MINRSELEGLGEIEGTIYLTGHKSPDMDTVGSSIAAAAMLRELGYDAQAVVLGPINSETEYVLKAAGVEIPPIMEDLSGQNMILLDHNEYLLSGAGLEDARILAIIDHHGAGNIRSGSQLIYDTRPLGSTATIVWIRCRNYGIEISPEIAYVMVGSILSDTRNLTSNTTTFADREALKALSQLAGITDTDAMYQEMFKESLSYGIRRTRRFFTVITRSTRAAGPNSRSAVSTSMMKRPPATWQNA